MISSQSLRKNHLFPKERKPQIIINQIEKPHERKTLIKVPNSKISNVDDGRCIFLEETNSSELIRLQLPGSGDNECRSRVYVCSEEGEGESERCAEDEDGIQAWREREGIGFAEWAVEEKERISAPAVVIAVEEEERGFGEIRVFVEELEATGERK